MRYISTRGRAPILDFQGATLAGLASDGGLYVPETWPQFTQDEIAAMAGLSYAEVAVRVCRPFTGDCLDEAALREIFTTAYGRFAHAAVAPLKQLDQRHWLLELFHGPTLAFKDFALQALGLVFERFLAASGQHLTVIGATSGDTGSAAIDALAGRAGVEVYMLHPHERVSPVQRRQMTSVLAPNIHNIAIEGNFDDAQALVKAMFNDAAFAGRFQLAAVNSINWARLMFQVVYYFTSALALGGPQRAIAYAVPTGNFGDIFAGYVAAQMGLPIERLVVATNENDILHRALSVGDYSAGTVQPTDSPSMDIQVSSNFERLLFDLAGRDGGAMAERMAAFEATKRMIIPPEHLAAAQQLMASARIDAGEMADTMRWAQQQCGEVLDPHTAIGLAAARRDTGTAPMVTLATAHPAKFPAAVAAACGAAPALPSRLADLMTRPERFDIAPAQLQAIEAYIAARATPR
ncbi:threonine synthase [Sandarakinorhabdus sp.]|uniref:threonine synthase n=1 Tax=Sandarakinorhabdus sp. TaxID=1916663 RepID=UPI00333E8CD6